MNNVAPHTWHWQPYGTPWKGVAIYHVSFSVNHILPDRQLLGKLVYLGLEMPIDVLHGHGDTRSLYRSRHRAAPCRHSRGNETFLAQLPKGGSPLIFQSSQFCRPSREHLRAPTFLTLLNRLYR